MFAQLIRKITEYNKATEYKPKAQDQLAMMAKCSLSESHGKYTGTECLQYNPAT